jgi:hypothetical protein
MKGSVVSVESGQIRVLPSFADMLVCQRIGRHLGGHFNAGTRAWLFLATPENARLLCDRLRTVRTTPEVDALLSLASIPQSEQGSALASVRQVVPVEPEIAIPAGMLTRPWRHQQAAFQFCLDHFAAGLRGILLAMGMGTGKTLVACMLVLALAARRVLISCPLRVVPVWITQFERHVGVPVVIVALDEDVGPVAKKQEVAAQKMKLAEALGRPFIVIINYDSAWRDPFAAWAEKTGWDLVIADECVPPGTMIATPGGSVPIESVKDGDIILALDDQDRLVRSEVTATFRRFSSQPFVQIDSFVGTQNHPVWIKGKGFVEAAAVRPGDTVRVYANTHDHLRVVRYVVHENEAGRGCPERLVFNLETSAGNYFANGVLVHNCHRLKAPGGKASLFFKRLRSRANHRVALTGTPMPHGPMDIYAVFRFLDVTIFGPSFSAFRQKYAVMGGYQRKQITGFQKLEQLEALMSRITFRVGAEVLDLPPATHVTYQCDLSPEAARIYRDLEEDFVAHVLDGTVTAANALVKLLRLQQVTGGCLPTDDGITHRVDSGKQSLLADTLEDIGREEAVVVFCRFHADLDAVHDACKALRFGSLELSGRRDELKRWQDGEAQVLAVQISAGGIGVDLTRARYSIYYSLSFSLGEYDQALARVHRPGQTRPVEHIHLVARNTVDVKIMRALEKRAEIVQAILAEIKN